MIQAQMIMDDVPTQPDPDKPETRSRMVRDDDDAASTVAQSLRHTHHVRRLKLILPLAAVALVVVMFAWSNMDKPAAPVKRSSISPQTVGKNELIKPKFQSQDAKQQPYTITADRAFQQPDDLDRVILQKPVADIAMKNGDWIAIKARDGEYLQGAQQLKLTGDVHLFQDKGYELTTQQVDLDVARQTAVSSQAVSGHGPAGTLQGQGLEANGLTGILIITGPARMTLQPAQPSAQPETH